MTSTSLNMQRTIGSEISFSGIGLFTGEKTSIIIKPSKEDTGVSFQLMNVSKKPKICAHVDFVKKTPRCTILGISDNLLYTVEHLLSAIYALGLDNLLIEVFGKEIPALDGSAIDFFKELKKVGFVEQKKEKKIIEIKKPIYLSIDDTHLVALPYKGFKISYTLDFDKKYLSKTQFFSKVINEEVFENEIASARTFSIYEEVKPFLDNGLIKGGSLNNAVVIKEGKLLNPEKMRFEDEMVRHKVLDIIGDFSLLGKKILGHIIAIKSGHFANISFVKEIIKNISEAR